MAVTRNGFNGKNGGIRSLRRGERIPKKGGTKLFRFAAFWSWSFVRVISRPVGNGFTSFVGVLWSRRWFLFFFRAAETLEPKHSTCFGFAHLACGRLYSTLQFKKIQRLNFDFLAEHPKVKVEMNGSWLPTKQFFSPLLAGDMHLAGAWTAAGTFTASSAFLSMFFVKKTHF